MLTNNQFQIYNSLIRNIYMSSSLQELRVNVLSGLQTLVPYFSAAFFLINPQTLEVSESLFYGFDSSFLTAYRNYDHLIENNQASVFSQAIIPSVNVGSNDRHHGRRARMEDRAEFLFGQGICYMACLQISHHELISGELSLYRNQEQADFNDDEMLLLTFLREHINDRFSYLHTLLPKCDEPFEFGVWSLTKREAQIVSLISLGKTNKQIAHDLDVSENTVKTFLKRLFNKMGVHSRSEMISKLLKQTPTGNIII